MLKRIGIKPDDKEEKKRGRMRDSLTKSEEENYKEENDDTAVTNWLTGSSFFSLLVFYLVALTLFVGLSIFLFFAYSLLIFSHRLTIRYFPLSFITAPRLTRLTLALCCCCCHRCVPPSAISPYRQRAPISVNSPSAFTEYLSLCRFNKVNDRLCKVKKPFRYISTSNVGFNRSSGFQTSLWFLIE